MKKKYARLFFVLSAIFLPFLILISPDLFKIDGIGPTWSVIWLLPWTLEKGKRFGLFTGFCVGLFLDGLSIGGVTQIPALMILGLWWGKLGIEGKPITSIFHLGLLALLGSIFTSFSFWIQIFFIEGFISTDWFNSWALYTLLAQAILTGLLAPMICSWVLLARRTPY